MHAKFCLCPPRLESLFPLVFWKSYHQIPLAFKVRFPEDSYSLCQIPSLGSLMRDSEPSQQCETSLVLFSSLWVTHPVGMGFDFIMIMRFLRSCCSLFFVFGHGVPFFGRFRHPPVNGCTRTSCRKNLFVFGAVPVPFHGILL